MKKLLSKTLAMLIIFILCISTFTACGDPNNGEHVHNFNILKFDETNHWYECECKATTEAEAHSGGTSTCKEKASCSVCSTKYGIYVMHSYKDSICEWCGSVEFSSICDPGSKYAYLGKYPQTVYGKTASVSETPNEHGFYVGSDGNEYAKVKTDVIDNRIKFNNGSSIEKWTTYYFRSEPIRWRVLNKTETTATLMCDRIIEYMPYDSNNNLFYNESEIRSWLNNEFYNYAFSDLEKSVIRTTVVDNSSASVKVDLSENACENTNDKVYLLSYEEAFNLSRAIDRSPARAVKTTDYIKAKGAFTLVNDNTYAGNGSWWLRSAPDRSYSSSYISTPTGTIYGTSVASSYCGVVPVIQIDLVDHVCNFTEKTESSEFLATSATCQNKATYYYSCKCGKRDTNTFESNTIADHNYINGKCKWCNEQGLAYVKADNYIYFGRYPQTIKADGVTVSTTPNDNGYYVGSDGEEYVKAVATYTSSYSSTFVTGFSNKRGVKDGKEYYFKVEPLRWKILKETDGVVTLLCDSIIDSFVYDDDSTNYKNSNIRSWLNNEFYNTAFGDVEQSIIQTTLVDNSKASTGYNSNQYACENTQDKIFLLSYVEVKNLETTPQLENLLGITPTDYSQTKYPYNQWWLRSPSRVDGIVSTASFVDKVNIQTFKNNMNQIGVVPALKIKL